MLHDEIDQNILKELEQNSRLPIATLARRVSLSRNAVRQRIERLERNKTITGYTIKRGDYGDQENKVSAFMFISRKDRMRGADITSVIRSIPEIRSCHVVSGDLDLVVRIVANSQKNIQKIWQDLAKLSGVLDINTCFSLSTILDKDNRS